MDNQPRKPEEQRENKPGDLLEAHVIPMIGSWEADLANHTVRWSDEMYRILETGPDQVEHTQAGFLRFVHPDDRQRVEETFARSISRQGVFADEHRLLLADGKIKFIEERWSVFYDDRGRAVRAAGTSQDITARKSVEESLRNSQTLLRMAGRLARMGGWSVELPDFKVTWSDEVCAIHETLPGFAPTIEEGINYYAPECRETIARAFDDCVRKGTPFDLEVQIITAKSRRVWVRAVGEAVRDVAGKIIQVQGAFQDISARKLAEEQIVRHAEELRTSEEQYRLLFTGSPLPMWLHDFETLRFLAVNEAAVRHYGYTEKEFLGMTIVDLRPPEDKEKFLRAVRERSATGKRSLRDRHRKKDGTIVEVEVTSDSIILQGRSMRLTSVNDITERVRIEREAAWSNRALRMLSRCNESLIRADSEEQLLDSICQITVDIGGVRMAWVGYAQDDPYKSIRPQTHAGIEEGYLSELQLSWSEDNPLGQGPAGRAIRSGRAVVIPEFAREPAYSPWLARAHARGYRGGICLPLKHQEITFGVLALYFSEVRVVPVDELALLQELADDLAFGIMNQRALLESRKTHDAVLAMARGVSASTGAEFFEKLTHSMVEAMGAHAGFIAQFLPENKDRVLTLSAVVAGQSVPNFEASSLGTPCAELTGTEVLLVPRDVRQRFPQALALIEMEIEAYVGALLLDVAGSPIGLIAVLFRQPLKQQDFVCSTLRIFAARAAAELQRQLAFAKTREQAALLDKTRDAIIVRDLQHRIVFWSHGAEQLYGWTGAEALGRSARELLYSDQGVFDQIMEKFLAEGEWNGEISHRSKDGENLTVDGRWTLVRDDAGRPQSVLAINTDITERKKLEQQFLRAQRMESIGTLAGGIAHDLNNLLAPITMGVELLRRSDPNPRSLLVIDTIERSSRRGADLVKQVLSFARGVEGSRVALQVKHIIREVESIAENTFRKNIIIHSEISPDLWLVMADPTQLNQVILNLCVNARDAMPNGGKLTIAASNVEIDEQYAVMNHGVTPGRYVVIGVTDNGCGMPQEVIDRIFEPFFTTKEQGKGTGLGLSTVTGIMRSHGGFVNVYSEVGKGSVFKVYLPALSEQIAEGTKPAEEEKFPRGNGETILVVDDEATILDVTKQTLRTFGYKVVTAEDGAQAIGLYALQRDEIALVITDMMMPVMDGPALIAALRRINPSVPVIAASGLIASGNVARAANAGVRHFLNKPYSADEMLKLMKAVLADRSSRPPM